MTTNVAGLKSGSSVGLFEGRGVLEIPYKVQELEIVIQLQTAFLQQC